MNLGREPALRPSPLPTLHHLNDLSLGHDIIATISISQYSEFYLSRQHMNRDSLHGSCGWTSNSVEYAGTPCCVTVVS